MEQIQHKLMLPLWAKAGGLLCVDLTIPAALSIAASKSTREKEQQLTDSSSVQPGEGTQTLSPD